MLNVILTVVSLSASAGIMFLLYLATQRLLQKHLPASARYAILLVILLRLLVPYSPEFALMNGFAGGRFGDSNARQAAPTNRMQTADTENHTCADNDDTPRLLSPAQPTVHDESAAPALSSENEPKESDAPPREFPLAAVLLLMWLTAAVGIFGVNVTAYLLCRRSILAEADYSEIHTRMLADIARGRRYPNVFLSDGTDTPMVLGLANSVIVLPKEDYTLVETEHILRHELCHYRRFDVAIKWLAVAACSLHWFNPLMILFRRELEDLCEFSCDEAVTRRMDSAERKAYIRTLLKTAARQVDLDIVPLTAMTGSAKRLDERFAAIANRKHLTPARAALSMTTLLSVAAVGLCLGACMPASHGAGQDSQNNIAVSPTNSDDSDAYLLSRYGYQAMNFEMTDPNAADKDKQLGWKGPAENDYYQRQPTLFGNTEQRTLMRAVRNLLNYEKYERIGQVQSMEFFVSDAIHVHFYQDLHFYLEKHGNLFVWPDSVDNYDFLPWRQTYPDYLTEDRFAVFEVPDDLYGKVVSMLYPLVEQEEVQAREQLLAQYPFADIDNDFVYAVLCDKLRIISDDYGCDFYAEVGSKAYEAVWELFKGIGQYDQIQAQPALAQTDTHIMIIGPEDYGEPYTGESITIYADSGVICARFKSDEMWYRLPKDLAKRCAEIAAGS